MSILRCISGVVLFPGATVLLFTLDKSLNSEEGLEQVKAYLTNPLAKLVIWDLLSALLYHLVVGVRHLVIDAGVGGTLEGGGCGSKIVIAITVVLIVLAGV